MIFAGFSSRTAPHERTSHIRSERDDAPAITMSRSQPSERDGGSPPRTTAAHGSSSACGRDDETSGLEMRPYLGERPRPINRTRGSEPLQEWNNSRYSYIW